MKRDKDEIENIVCAIRQLVRTASSDSLDIVRSLKLTPSQSKILKCVHKQGPCSSAQLSRLLSLSPSNITGIVDRLQLKGLVKRVPKLGDRRVAIIKLTPAGKKIGENLPETFENRLVSSLKRLERSEVKKLGGALDTIIEMIEK